MIKKEKEDIRVVYKEMNNKSRKGTYAYVKKKGQRGSYYKVKDEIGKKDNAYKLIYKTGGIRSSKGVTKKRIQELKKGNIKFKKYANIEQSFKSGYAQTTIENANKLSHYGMKTAYMNLLRNKDKVGNKLGIIRDKELLSIITRPEDVEKWKHRIMYEIILKDQKDENIATLVPEGVKNLNDIKREVIGKIIIGQEFSTMYKDLGDVAKKYGYRFNSNNDKKGRITGIKIKMIFKKG